MPVRVCLQKRVDRKRKSKQGLSVSFSDDNKEHYYKREQGFSSDLSKETPHQISEFHPSKLETLKTVSKTNAQEESKSDADCSVKDTVTKPGEMKVAADLVVKYLTPAFKEGRISSKVSVQKMYFWRKNDLRLHKTNKTKSLVFSRNYSKVWQEVCRVRCHESRLLWRNVSIRGV